jgi:hypothetical protein
MNKSRYGARIARTSFEPCTACGAYVTLTELTFRRLVNGGADEMHLTEECDHETTREVHVWCPPSEAEFTY